MLPQTKFLQLYRFILLSVLMLALCTSIAAQQLGTSGAGEKEYVLGPDDVFAVTVLRHPEYSGEYLVPASGSLQIVAVGSINVIGRTIGQISDDIVGSLKKRLKNPEVYVFLKSRRLAKVYVTGDVRSAGGVEYQPNWRLLDAISSAGGVIQPAPTSTTVGEGTNPSEVTVTLFRKGGTPFKQQLEKVLQNTPESNPPLEPGDIVYVSLQEHVRVYLTGKVRNPGQFKLPSKTGLLAAISMAGGLADDASSAGIKILHLDGTEETANVSNILVNGKNGPLPVLAEGDTVVVPELTNKVVILGLVSHPGSYPLQDGKTYTVTDVIALAQGQDTKAARLGKVGLIRLVNGKPQKMILNVARYIHSGRLEDNPIVQPGDFIYVPETNSIQWSSVFSVLSEALLFKKL